jgi:dihydroneopterin aldolase
MSIQRDFPAIQRFEKLGNTDWETLKKLYVTTLYLEAGAQEQAAQKMQAHIEDRDIVDYASYREAILRIFPSSYFNLAAEIAGKVAEIPADGYTFTAKWYEFIVTKKTAHLPTGLEESQKCKIAIKAPGSRKLTSDIDTSILTTFTGESSFFEHAEARVKKERADYEGRITNAIIDEFYKISEELFKMTSSSQRDSNAYIDTITKDKENYSKFLHDEENNPLIQGERLFSEEEFTKKFKEYKYKKHVQEMAASLFSLHTSLEQEEWEVFKDLVKKRLSKILKSELPKDVQETYISLCQQDYDTIFQRAEKLRRHHLKKLNVKIGELSQLDPLPVRTQDIPIAALNRLYVEHLEKCTECYEQILALKSERKPLMDELEGKKQALDKELAALKRLGDSSNHPAIQEVIEKIRKACAVLEESCQKLKGSLRQNIIKTAQQQTEHQLHQILASTFANEAYVCRSAVYHVMNGQSGVTKLPISQQTLLGSALQQVGFKLLHTKELTHKRFSPEEIAYYTAKYGQRLFNLVFSGHNAEFDDDIIKPLARGKTNDKFPKFTYLKFEQVRHNAYSTFNRKELALLNDQAKIIHHIKSNPAILDAEKPRKTFELIPHLLSLSSEAEKRLYLSISAKLIGLVCASRLKQKGYLWGQNLLSPLRNATEEERLEGSVSVISAPAPLQPPEPLETIGEGIAIDEHHQIGEDAKGLVMSEKGGTAEARHITQGPRSGLAVAVNLPKEAAQRLAEGVFGHHPK